MKIDAWLIIFAFQVQIEVMQKRQKEKTAMMNAVKKYQKGNISHLLMFPKSFNNIDVYTLIKSCCCFICSSDSDSFMYNICPNSENFLLYLKFEFIWFSLLGMSDKLDFLEGEKKGKASSQDPKKAVNKKGWADLLSIQNWKLASGSFSLFSLSYCEGISASRSKLWKTTRH